MPSNKAACVAVMSAQKHAIIFLTLYLLNLLYSLIPIPYIFHYDGLEPSLFHFSIAQWGRKEEKEKLGHVKKQPRRLVELTPLIFFMTNCSAKAAPLSPPDCVGNNDTGRIEFSFVE